MAQPLLNESKPKLKGSYMNAFKAGVKYKDLVTALALTFALNWAVFVFISWLFS